MAGVVILCNLRQARNEVIQTYWENANQAAGLGFETPCWENANQASGHMKAFRLPTVKE